MGDFEAAYLASCQLCDVDPCELVLECFSRYLRNGGKGGLELELPGNSLQLFKRRLGNSDIQALAAAVKNSGILVSTLNLSYNLLDDHSMESVVDIIMQGQAKTLNLMSNGIGAEGLQMLLDFLVGDASSVRVLILNSNPLGKEGGMALAEVLRNDEKLQHVDIGCTEQDTDSIIALASAMVHNATVEVLNLDNPRLFSYDNETAIHIADMIQASKTIRELSLAKHGLRCTHASILSEALQRSCSIRTLDLKCNEISVKGAESLARLILSHDCSVENLDLRGNRVADQGAKALGASLEYASSLQTLDLSSNGINDFGLSTIARGLAVNGCLKKICLWGNNFGEESSRLFYDLYTGRFKHTNLELDFEPNVPQDCESKDEIHIARS